eukprot:gene31563-38149_t
MELAYREATLEDASIVVEVTNDAFMADTFFKKPEYHLRFTLDTVISMINTGNSVFILAETDRHSSRMVVGSLYLHWEVHDDEVIGKFSAVSVPSKHGKKGIGKGLVAAAERKIREIASTFSKNHARLQMGVINKRTDLFPWYEAQGFRVLGEIRPNDPEVEMITLDDMKDTICCVLMEKVLA